MTNGWSACFRMLHSVIAYFKCLFLYRKAFLRTFMAYSSGFPFNLHLKTLPKAPCPSISRMSNDLKPIPRRTPSSSRTTSYFFIFSISSGGSSTLFCISFIRDKSFWKSVLFPSFDDCEIYAVSFDLPSLLKSYLAAANPPCLSGGVMVSPDKVLPVVVDAGVLSVLELLSSSSFIYPRMVYVYFSSNDCARFLA